MKSDNSIFKRSLSVLTLILLVAFSLKACTKDEYPTGTITVTTAAPKVGFIIRTPKGYHNLTIDWGDGNRSNVNDAFYDEIGYDFHEFRFLHDYSTSNAHTIVIDGLITHFNCRGMQLTNLDLSRIKALVSLDSSENLLTKLDVSTNNALNHLECDFNQLINLNVSKNKKLWLLSCVGNQLTAPALNDLFKSLPRCEIRNSTK